MNNIASGAAPAAEAPAPSGPVIRIVDDGRRSRAVPLSWPIEVDGRVIDAVIVRRLTTKEVADYVEAVSAAGVELKVFRFPMYFDVNGNRLADAVIDALDDDDALDLSEVATSFLPRRFRINTAPDTSPPSGEPTGPL